MYVHVSQITGFLPLAPTALIMDRSCCFVFNGYCDMHVFLEETESPLHSMHAGRNEPVRSHAGVVPVSGHVSVSYVLAEPAWRALAAGVIQTAGNGDTSRDLCIRNAVLKQRPSYRVCHLCFLE
jgi:hypothetical protein